ncbi:hypothetical protein [Bradyrhizobium sp. CCBAU 11386]|uniref:hypothetical protein n=1 Tax=Bradyrhizobium sp. CCBAU 11386 TaxID=1630837 RepID=UPI00230385DA|nr:hypothetical protein [Bradyrhizobium sp. CCBAU 11386]
MYALLSSGRWKRRRPGDEEQLFALPITPLGEVHDRPTGDDPISPDVTIIWNMASPGYWSSLCFGMEQGQRRLTIGRVEIGDAAFKRIQNAYVLDAAFEVSGDLFERMIRRYQAAQRSGRSISIRPPRTPGSVARRLVAPRTT